MFCQKEECKGHSLCQVFGPSVVSEKGEEGGSGGVGWLIGQAS